jgi:ribosomal protein S14
MLYLKKKDNKNRFDFHKLEKKKIIFKYIFIQLSNRFKKNKNSSVLNKILFSFSKIFLKKNSNFNSKTKLFRRCIVSNRNRANLRPYNFSRIVLRNFIQFGLIPGYKKAVW